MHFFCYLLAIGLQVSPEPRPLSAPTYRTRKIIVPLQRKSVVVGWASAGKAVNTIPEAQSVFRRVSGSCYFPCSSESSACGRVTWRLSLLLPTGNLFKIWGALPLCFCLYVSCALMLSFPEFWRPFHYWVLLNSKMFCLLLKAIHTLKCEHIWFRARARGSSPRKRKGPNCFGALAGLPFCSQTWPNAMMSHAFKKWLPHFGLKSHSLLSFISLLPCLELHSSHSSVLSHSSYRSRT